MEFVLPLFLFFLSCAGHRVRHSLLHATQDNIVSDSSRTPLRLFFCLARVELKRPNKNFRSGEKKKTPGPGFRLRFLHKTAHVLGRKKKELPTE